MDQRYTPTNHESENAGNQDSCQFIERMRKIRAMNSDPAMLGYSGTEFKSFLMGIYRFKAA